METDADKPTPAPLSLDEAEQLPPTSPPSSRSGRGRWVLLGLLTAAVAVGTFTYVRFGRGVLPEGVWREVRPAGEGFRVLLPAEPEEETIPANPLSPVTRPGKRYVAHRWYEQVTVSAGWLDLDPERAKRSRFEDVIAAERDRFARERNGTVAGEAAVKFDAHDGRQFTLTTPSGLWVVRYVYAAEATQPRLYFVAVGGPKVDPEGPTARKALESLRLTK